MGGPDFRRARQAAMSATSCRRCQQPLTGSVCPRCEAGTTDRRAVVARARAIGATAAAAEAGVHRTTVSLWAKALGVRLPRGRRVRPAPPAAPRLTKEQAECCQAARLPDGRPPIGFCGPDCVRRRAGR